MFYANSLLLFYFFYFFFFFQAEDGIRDRLVTGVQTCALPISERTEYMNVTSEQNVTVFNHTGTEVNETVLMNITNIVSYIVNDFNLTSYTEILLSLSRNLTIA